MKTIIVLILIWGSTLALAQEGPYSAQLFYFKGNVTLSTDGGAFGGVDKNELLSVGDVIKTGKRSFAIVRFPDKSTMRVDQNSEIKIEAIVERIEKTSLGASEIFIKAGRAVIDVVNKSKAPVFNIRTKDVAMGVRGTRLMAGIDSENGATDLAVDRGEVEVSQIGKPSVADAILAGHAIHIENGREFTQPQKYDWVKKFNFNTNDKNLDHAKNEFVHEGKRREFRNKRKAWKRDNKRWLEKKEKWKKLRAEYLNRSDELKDKRKEFREKKKIFQNKRKKVIEKRNALILEERELRKESILLNREKMKLSKESRLLKTGRKDPRKKIENSRKRKDISLRAQSLKEKRKKFKEKKASLAGEKIDLHKEMKTNKKKIKKLRQRNKRDADKLRRMRMRNKKKKMLKRRLHQHNAPAPSGGDTTNGGGTIGH